MGLGNGTSCDLKFRWDTVKTQNFLFVSLLYKEMWVQGLFGFGTLDEKAQAEGVPLPLAQAGMDRIRCQVYGGTLTLVLWSNNPCKLLILKGLSPAWLSNWALLRNYYNH